MLAFIMRFFRDLLWDEAAAQRYIAMILLGVGAVLTNGGAIPGTGIVIGGLAPYSGWGTPLQALAMFIGAGGKIPGIGGK